MGLGNALMGDDGFGVAVARRLLEDPSVLGAPEVAFAGTDLLAFLESFSDYDQVILIDALVGLDHPGEVRVYEEAEWSDWPDGFTDAHTLSPIAAVRLFRSLYPEARTTFTLVALHVPAVGLEPRFLTEEAINTAISALRRLHQTRGFR